MTIKNCSTNQWVYQKTLNLMLILNPLKKVAKKFSSIKIMRVKVFKLCGFHLLVLSTKVIGNFLNFNFKGRWVAKLKARLLATAALRVRIQ
jgi:hypothetical protein